MSSLRLLELYKEFQEEAHSVALHPTGLFILVGFSDKLRLMNLLIDDIRAIKEFSVRGCREVGYARVRWQPREAPPTSSPLHFISVPLCRSVCLQPRRPPVCSRQWKRHPHLLRHLF